MVLRCFYQHVIVVSVVGISDGTSSAIYSTLTSSHRGTDDSVDGGSCLRVTTDPRSWISPSW